MKTGQAAYCGLARPAVSLKPPAQVVSRWPSCGPSPGRPCHPVASSCLRPTAHLLLSRIARAPSFDVRVHNDSFCVNRVISFEDLEVAGFLTPLFALFLEARLRFFERRTAPALPSGNSSGLYLGRRRPRCFSYTSGVFCLSGSESRKSPCGRLLTGWIDSA